MRIENRASLYVWNRYYMRREEMDALLYCENDGTDLFIALEVGGGKWDLYTLEGYAGWFKKEVRVATRLL